MSITETEIDNDSLREVISLLKDVGFIQDGQ